jgi:hypothetical protein
MRAAFLAAGATAAACVGALPAVGPVAAHLPGADVLRAHARVLTGDGAPPSSGGPSLGELARRPRLDPWTRVRLHPNGSIPVRPHAGGGAEPPAGRASDEGAGVGHAGRPVSDTASPPSEVSAGRPASSGGPGLHGDIPEAVLRHFGLTRRPGGGGGGNSSDDDGHEGEGEGADGSGDDAAEVDVEDADEEGGHHNESDDGSGGDAEGEGHGGGGGGGGRRHGGRHLRASARTQQSQSQSHSRRLTGSVTTLYNTYSGAPAASVKILWEPQAGYAAICSGSMVSPFHVLTAGHCVYNYPSGFYTIANNYYVVPGQTDVLAPIATDGFST